MKKYLNLFTLVAILFGCAFNLLPVSSAKAQGIYEIKYTFPDNPSIEYSALIFFYSNDSENNLMRVRFQDNAGWNVTDEKFKIVQFDSDGKNYWVIKGEEANNLTKPSQTYFPDDIFLSKSPSDTYYRPDFTATRPAPQRVFGTITSYKVLDKNDITNDYLTDFNLKWADNQDTFYPAKIDLILVSNSNDVNLGTGFSANHRKIKQIFSDIATTCGIAMQVTEVQGDDFNKSNVLQAINNFSPGNNDIVIFYYSGHGYHRNSDDSAWPFMDMRQGIAAGLDDNSISLDRDIYQPLCAKGARLTVVIGDCCNTFAGSELPIRENPALMAPSDMLNSASLKTLFNKTGKLLIATSSPNEPSYYSVNVGGDFCNDFIRSLIQETGIGNQPGQIKWQHLIDSANDATTKDSENMPTQQHPKYHFDISE